MAETGAPFLCRVAGIDQTTLDNSVAYIDGWRRVISDDPRLVVNAASQAQRAADFILGQTRKENADWAQ